MAGGVREAKDPAVARIQNVQLGCVAEKGWKGWCFQIRLQEPTMMIADGNGDQTVRDVIKILWADCGILSHTIGLTWQYIWVLISRVWPTAVSICRARHCRG